MNFPNRELTRRRSVREGCVRRPRPEHRFDQTGFRGVFDSVSAVGLSGWESYSLAGSSDGHATRERQHIRARPMRENTNPLAPKTSRIHVANGFTGFQIETSDTPHHVGKTSTPVTDRVVSIDWRSFVSDDFQITGKGFGTPASPTHRARHSRRRGLRRCAPIREIGATRSQQPITGQEQDEANGLATEKWKEQQHAIKTRGKTFDLRKKLQLVLGMLRG